MVQSGYAWWGVWWWYRVVMRGGGGGGGGGGGDGGGNGVYESDFYWLYFPDLYILIGKLGQFHHKPYM